MFKQFILILSILLIGIVLAASENRPVDVSNSANSTIRNANHYKLNKLSGKSNIKEDTNFSEDFNLPILRSNWSSKSESSYWSLKERPGFLRLKSQQKDIKHIISNSFSKEIEFNSICDATCQIDLSNLKEGNETGMYFSNKNLNYIQIRISKGIKKLELVINNKVYEGPDVEVSDIMFCTRIETTKAWFEYSIDGSNFIKLGEAFVLNASHKRSDNIGVFCFSQSENGSADIDWFYFKQKESSTVKFAELIR